MENKEDLLNLENNNKNPKKIIIYIAAGFLIFVIGVIIFAVVQGNSNTKENNTVIPPQVKEEPLFKQIPIEKENNTTAKNNNIKPNNSSQISLQQPNKNNSKEQNISKTQPISVKENKNLKEMPVKPLKVENKAKPVSKVEKHISKKVKKGNYYIQVAALMKYAKPNKKFLELIKKYGYNYTFYTVVINRDGKRVTIHKVLIGPFESKAKARKELIKIKKYITQNAFIFKVNR